MINIKILLIGIFLSLELIIKAQIGLYKAECTTNMEITTCNSENDEPPFSFTSSYWGSCTVGKDFTVKVGGQLPCLTTFTFKGATSGSSEKFKNKACYTALTCYWEEQDHSAKVTFYTFPTITFIDKDTPHFCVGDESSKSFKFDFEYNHALVKNKVISEAYLQFSTSSDFSSVSEFKLSLTQSRNKLSFNDITNSKPSQWYGKNIFFRVKINFSGTAKTGPVSSSYMFFRSVPTPSLISVDRSACVPERVTLKVAPEIALNIDDYRFRAIADSEQTNSPVRFKEISINTQRNEVLLEVLSGKNDVRLARKASLYKFHAFDVNLNNIKDLSEHTCVEKWEDNIELPRPSLPSQSLTWEKVGTTEYNLTRHDSQDGKCEIHVSNLSKSDTPLYVEYKEAGGTTQKVAFTSLTSGGTDTRVLSGLKAKKYDIRVVDEDGCPSAQGFQGETLKAPDPVSINTLYNNQKVTCHPQNETTDPAAKKNGQLSISWSGGIPPYTVKYGNGQQITGVQGSNETIENLASGSYNVTVTDNYGVLATQSKEVLSNPKVGFNFTNRPVKCYGDNTDITINIENGQTGNSFQLYNLNGDLLHPGSTGILPDTYVFYGQPAQQYRVDVASGKCMASDTIEITGPDDINFQATGSKIAVHGGADGRIELDISGGTGQFTYKVYDVLGTKVDSNVTRQLATISNLSHGRYNVTITDENACVKEQKAIFVRQPDAPLKLNFTQKDVDCFGNSTAEVYPTATGGWGHYEYGFNGLVITSENIISGLDATTTRDTVFVVDSANVVYKLPVVITQPDVLGASIDKVHNLKCFEDNTGGVKLGITGGTTPYYVSTDNNNWTEGDSVDGLSATESQKLYVRDANNCETGLETQIAQPELLTIAKDTIIDAFCNQNNGGIHTVINGGTISKNYRYEWYYEDSAQVITNPDNQLLDIYSGRYKLAITDDHECKTESHFLVSDIDGPKINEYAVDSVSCFGGDNGTIYLTGVNGGMPGYAYYINGTESGAEMKGLAEGTHHVRVLDKKGCKADAYIDVKEPGSLQVHEAINAPTCHDSWDASIIAVPSGGNGRYVYIWNNGTTGAIIDSLNSGTYGVTITDYKNCSIKQQYEIVPPKMPKPGWDDKLALICTGNYIDVDGGDFKEWLWKNGKGEQVGSDRVAHLTETGNYILQITDGDGCVGLDTFKVDISDTPLDSKIILPDSAHVNERINVIDVTWPVPDSIEWLYDQPVEVLETNDWSQHFSATNEGEINVTLRAWYGGCYSDSSKTVMIFYEEGFEEGVFKSAGSLITGFRAFPNPNNGEFSIGVSLGREADISISLYAATNTKLIDKQEYKGLDRYEAPYTLGHLKPGMYVIILQAELEQQVMKIVIN